MQQSQPASLAGQHVVVRDERWVVLRTRACGSACIVHLRGVGDHNRGDTLAVVTPFDRVCPVPPATRVQRGTRQAALAAAARALASATRWTDCWTARDAQIDLRRWQFEPAIAATEGRARMLLADAVGMGKTIQAGLLITELTARGLADRVLILTPASIREQWARELRERFGLAPRVFDHATLSATAALTPPDVNPWKVARLVISSIDLVKRPETRAALESLVFDILVVDEAHHLTPASERGALVAELAARSLWVVLVTATPHRGDPAAFAFLEGLGRVADEPLHVFRRAPRAVVGLMPRRSKMLFVCPTASERALFEAMSRYTRALLAERSTGARLVASVLARRAAASAEAARRSLGRRIAILSAGTSPTRQTLLPWDEEDADTEEDSLLGTAGLTDTTREIDWLQTLLALAERAAAGSSKIDVVRRLLRRTKESLLVFSEYRDVVLWTAEALEGLGRVAVLHGGLSAREREHAVHEFQQGHARVLVATDAAGEGLNLHARCRLVVTMELPWLPLRLEQRVGRVDRIGQTRRVHAIHLVHRDSFEGIVIARLERRRAYRLQFTSETSAAEDAHPAITWRHMRPAVQQDTGRRTAAVYAARLTRPSSEVWLLYLVTTTAADGRFVQSDVLPVRVSLPTPLRHLTRQVLRRLSAHPQVLTLLSQESAARTEAAADALRGPAARIRGRVGAIGSHVAMHTGRTQWQASLFDRRTERAAYARAASVESIRNDLARRRDAADALLQLTASAPRLVAAWCV